MSLRRAKSFHARHRRTSRRGQSRSRETGDALERYLRPQSANGKKWLAYLKWDAFQTALDAEGPIDFARSWRPTNNSTKIKPASNSSRSVAVADALRHYIDLAVMARQKDQTATYGGQLDGLAKELEQYSAAPAAATGSAIGRRLDLLAGLGQAPELVAAVRESSRSRTRSSPCRPTCCAKPLRTRSTATIRSPT